MKKQFAALALLVFASFAAYAAEMPKPDLYLIHDELVSPSMVAKYEAASKEFFAAMAEKKISLPSLRFTTFMTPDFHYLYVVNLGKTFAGMDALHNDFMSATEIVGKERWHDLEMRASATMSSYAEYFAMNRDDLSYVPANPRLKPEERQYIRWQLYYLVPGKEQEAEAIARDYVALFKQKNIPDGFSIYMGVVGKDLPLLVAAAGGKSPADYAAADEKTNATLGADVRPLQQRAMAITRRFELREGFLRPDLCYPQPEKPIEKK